MSDGKPMDMRYHYGIMEQQHICHYETGRRAPSVHNLIKLACALDFTLDDLVGGEAEYDGTEIGEILSWLSKLRSEQISLIRELVRACYEGRADD